MKGNVFLIVCAFVLFASCGNRGGDSLTTYSDYEKPEGGDEVFRMKDYQHSAHISTVGAEYDYTIVRRAQDSLAVVTSEDGLCRFADNSATLKIVCRGVTIFSRTFTKRSFAGYLPEGFLKYGLLDGLAFERLERGRLCFVATVSYPETDYFFPLRIAVSPDGGFDVWECDEFDTPGDPLPDLDGEGV